MIERRIKELSIAQEALSRINSEAAQHHSREVSYLLDKMIDAAKQPPMMALGGTDDSLVTATRHTHARQSIDDEIPF